MSPELILAVASAIISVASGFISASASKRARRFEYQLEEQRRQEDAKVTAERILNQYREPLLSAAQTLQGRLFNIVAQSFLVRYYHDEADQAGRAYARDYTVYVIAEYLCWVEILRRELRFHDLADQHQELTMRLYDIQFAFQDDKIPHQFEVFRGRQRALAEIMMVPTNAPEGPRYEPMGYAAFSQRLTSDETFAGWFASLRSDIDIVARSTDAENIRLIRLQRELIDLLDYLDPKMVRVPEKFRQRIPDPGPDGAVMVPDQRTG